MDLFQLLKMGGVDTSLKIKLVRHQDNRYDTQKLYEKNELDIYQSYQSNNVFSDCQFIVSFLGCDRSKAKFIGVYKVNSVTQPVKPLNGHEDFWFEGCYYYELEKTQYLNDLTDRLVIDWGGATRSWYQWLNEKKPKAVIEILPKGYYDNFPGFEDFTLNFKTLKQIVDNPDANRTWHLMLSSVAGIYLIVDMKDGKQYIGSAYGEKGILGRWTDYAKTGHGNNKHLKTMPFDRYENFQFTILRTLPKTLTSKEVIFYESLYKKKLGTRANLLEEYGLNEN